MKIYAKLKPKQEACISHIYPKEYYDMPTWGKLLVKGNMEAVDMNKYDLYVKYNNARYKKIREELRSRYEER